MDIAELFGFAQERNASDLILTADSPPILRIDGEMRLMAADPLTAEQTKQLIYGILDDSQIARFESEHELDFSLFVKGTQHFRGNVFLQRGFVGAAFRLIPEQMPKLAELGSAAGHRAALHGAAGAHPRHRPDRPRQVHHAGGHD